MRAKATGSIINISSRSGFVGIPAAAAYASSKAAVRNHTKSVALYSAEQGLNIRCNSIQPAAILTPMWEPRLGDGPEREARTVAFVANTPMRRFGTVEKVAAIALLLASDEAPYMTGTELTVDGGLLAGSGAAPNAEWSGSTMLLAWSSMTSLTPSSQELRGCLDVRSSQNPVRLVHLTD